MVYQTSRGHVLDLRHQAADDVSDSDRSGWLPDASINGVPLDFDRWPTCESPYVSCRDRVLDVNDGRQGFTIDWQGDLPVGTRVSATPSQVDPRKGKVLLEVSPL